MRFKTKAGHVQQLGNKMQYWTKHLHIDRNTTTLVLPIHGYNLTKLRDKEMEKIEMEGRRER